MSDRHAAVGDLRRGLSAHHRRRTRPANRRATLFAPHLLERAHEGVRVLAEGDTCRPAYYEPVRSAVPVLLLSGDLDPVTPPTWAEQVQGHAAELAARASCPAPGTARSPPAAACGSCASSSSEASVDGLDDELRRVAEAAAVLPDAGGPRSWRRDSGAHAMIRVENLRKRFGPVVRRRRRELHRRGRRGDRACSARTAPARRRRCA